MTNRVKRGLAVGGLVSLLLILIAATANPLPAGVTAAGSDEIQFIRGGQVLTLDGSSGITVSERPYCPDTWNSTELDCGSGMCPGGMEIDCPFQYKLEPEGDFRAKNVSQVTLDCKVCGNLCDTGINCSQYLTCLQDDPVITLTSP